MGEIVFLVLYGAALAWGVWQYGGVVQETWNFTLAAVALLSAVYWLKRREVDRSPSPGRRLAGALCLIPLWTALQMIPMPLAVIRAMDPARARISDALASLGMAPSTTSLSVSPVLTFLQLLRVLAWILTFLAIREIAWRTRRQQWLAAVPLVVIALGETAYGLMIRSDGGVLAGTWVSPDHFGGFMEMALPFALLYTVSLIRRPKSDSLLWALRTALAAGVTLVLFLAVLLSMSRMSLVDVMISVWSVAGIAVFRGSGRKIRVALWVATPLILGLLIFFTAPADLITKLAFVFDESNPGFGGRLGFWQDTLQLIADYPLFGCGLGAYVSAVQKYRTSGASLLLDYAHNDYIQLFAELGLIGFIPAATAGFLILRKAWKNATTSLSFQQSLPALACFASLLSMALHSLVDFGLYIPANAMLLAWVAGYATALEPTQRQNHNAA